jgi:hypothetical protein
MPLCVVLFTTLYKHGALCSVYMLYTIRAYMYMLLCYMFIYFLLYYLQCCNKCNVGWGRAIKGLAVVILTSGYVISPNTQTTIFQKVWTSRNR